MAVYHVAYRIYIGYAGDEIEHACTQCYLWSTTYVEYMTSCT